MNIFSEPEAASWGVSDDSFSVKAFIIHAIRNQDWFLFYKYFAF